MFGQPGFLNVCVLSIHFYAATDCSVDRMGIGLWHDTPPNNGGAQYTAPLSRYGFSHAFVYMSWRLLALRYAAFCACVIRSIAGIADFMGPADKPKDVRNGPSKVPLRSIRQRALRSSRPDPVR